MQPLAPFASIERLEHAALLDPFIAVMRRVVHAAVQPQPVRDALHGAWLGHPLHPVAVQVPIGTWASATILDLVPGTGPASTALIGTGVVAALPAVASGWTDWSELSQRPARVGVVHAVTNATALTLYAASFLNRVRGRTARGKRLGLAGLAAVGVGGLLGGHLAYRQGAGVTPEARRTETATVDLTGTETPVEQRTGR